MYDPDLPSSKSVKRPTPSQEESIKVGEIRSKLTTPSGSQRVLELHYLGSKRDIAKSGNASSRHIPQPKTINYDLVSLPDQKDLCGSWRLLMNMESPLFSQRDLLKKDFKSHRHVDLAPEEDETGQAVPGQSKEVMRLRLVGVEDANAQQGRNSMVFHMQNELGQIVQIDNEQKNEFFSRIYGEIMTENDNRVKPGTNELEIGFNPKEAMVMLNDNFKLEAESYHVESQPESQREMYPSKISWTSSKFVKQQSFLPGLSNRTTIRAYTKKSSRLGSLGGRSRSMRIREEAQFRKLSTLSNPFNKDDKKGPDANASQSGEEPEEKGDSVDIYSEGSERKSKSIGIYSSENEKDETEEEEEEEEAKEKDIQVKLEIEVKRELWISLRMGPVLNFSEQIRDTLDEMGFEIKFIEDLEKNEKTKNEMLQQTKQIKEEQEIKRKATMVKSRTSIYRHFQTQNSKIFENNAPSALKLFGKGKKTGSEKKGSRRKDGKWEEDEMKLDVRMFDVLKEMENGKVKTMSFREAKEGQSQDRDKAKGRLTRRGLAVHEREEPGRQDHALPQSAGRDERRRHGLREEVQERAGLPADAQPRPGDSGRSGHADAAGQVEEARGQGDPQLQVEGEETQQDRLQARQRRTLDEPRLGGPRPVGGEELPHKFADRAGKGVRQAVQPFGGVREPGHGGSGGSVTREAGHWTKCACGSSCACGARTSRDYARTSCR